MAPTPRVHALLAAALLGACGSSSEPPRSGGGAWPVTVERAAGGAPAAGAYERVVLVTIDTLRADHVSAYGYARATTPFLDSLAERGALFTRVQASVSQTAPSHATMLTGLVPFAHGVLANGLALPPDALDLARLFRQAGVPSAAFLNVRFLSGITGGFDTTRVFAVGEINGKTEVLHGEHVVGATLQWLEKERTSERFFLWVHLYDPHHWKEAGQEDVRRVGSLWRGATPEDFYARVAALHGLPGEDEPFDLAWKPEAGQTIAPDSPQSYLHFVDAYDALIQYSDHQVERLYRAIEALALPGRTLWIVTSDHGEGLASHGVAGHGSRIYQEQLRVPLIVHASDGSIPQRRIEAPVGHVDLFATVAETLGARVSGDPRRYDGRSLWPLMNGTDAAWPERALFAQRRPAESEEEPDQERVFALLAGPHKYILHDPGADEFYDLAADPLELTNRSGAGDADEERLRAELEQRLLILESLTPASGADVPEDWAQELRNLGYAR